MKINKPPISKTITQRFLHGASWVMIGKVVGAPAALLANVLLARLLTPEEMGVYFLAFSIVITAAIVGQWGLNRGMVKLVAAELANHRSDLVRSSIVTSFILVCLVGGALGILTASPLGQWLLLKTFDSTLLISVSALVGLWIIIQSLQGLASETFRGFHDIRFATFFSGVVTSVISVSVYLLIWFRSGEATLLQAVQVMAASAGISLLIALFLLSKKVVGLARGEKVSISKVARFGFPLCLTSVAIFGVRELHLWTLAIYQPESSVAYYGAALRLVNLLVFALMIANSVLPPMVAELYSRKDFTAVQRVLQRAATVMSVLAALIFVFILLYGDDLIGLIFGEPYKSAYSVLVILATGQLINVLTGSPGVLLTMSGHEKSVMTSAIIGGGVGIVVSIVLAPNYGAVGVAVGYAISLALVNIFMWQYAWRKLSIRTHGDLGMLNEISKKIRAKIEFQGVNGGRFGFLDRYVRKIETLIWRVSGFDIYECFGDSHAAIFRGVNDKKWVGKRRFRAVSVRGATCYGVGNPNSQTNALELMTDRLSEIPKSRKLIFMMGEVDVGFLVWLRAMKSERSPESCMQEALERYMIFVLEVRKSHPHIIVCSAPLPTIADGESHGDVAGARQEIKASQAERTELTLEFNRRLKIWSLKEGLGYLDFDAHALDKETHLVKKELLNKNISDHHYDKEGFYELIEIVMSDEGGNGKFNSSSYEFKD